MARVVARCPKCGAGLSRRDIDGYPFRCPQCGSWLRTPRSRDGASLFVAAALGALIAYRLGFQGFALLLGTGIGMWVFFVPTMMLLEHVWPLRPELSWPDTGTLGLLNTNDRPSARHPGAAEEGRCGEADSTTPEPRPRAEDDHPTAS